MNTATISPEDAKRVTIQSYNDYSEEYIKKVNSANGRTLAYWPGVEQFLAQLPPRQTIFEIGSGSGNDALHIEQTGFKVRRSDAAESFLKALHSSGHEAIYYDVLIHPLKVQQSAIFANAVFLHFTTSQFRKALIHVHDSLDIGGLFCLGMKLGNFEGWRKKGLSGKRYFKFWDLNDLHEELQKANLATTKTYVAPDKDFAVITTRRSW